MKRRDFIKSSLAMTALATLSPWASLWSKEKIINDELRRSLFGPDFLFGVATSAYQIEGAYQEDGKGLSIWDTFANTKGKIKTGETGNVATDFYHLYEQDLDLLKQLNIPIFRFSFAWSRILPKGTGELNKKGLEFYHRVIDACIARGIEPWVTLYHWDLPQALEDKGGWTNREVIQWFKEYVAICVKEFKGKVKNWMIMNEPTAFTALGYMLGIHAPGKKGIDKFLRASHHTAMALAEGGRTIREIFPQANIGSTFSCSYIEPFKPKKRHQKAATRVEAVMNKFFLEAVLGRGYPFKDFPALKRIKKFMKPGDEQLLKFDLDFVGMQNYTREVVKYSLFRPVLWANQVKPEKRGVETTEMGWEVYPESVYQMLKIYASYPEIKKIIITESGSAFPDTLESDGRVHDEKRKKYLQDVLKQVLRAKKEGVPVQGYFIWTFTDNFEWAEGTRPRFGIVYVDFKTQKRYIKDSGRWFAEFLSK
jgi:beta-glucosidase